MCSLISSSEGVDSIYAKFCSFISNSLHLDSFPYHKSKKENHKKIHKPWWDGDLHVMRKEVRLALKAWLKNKLVVSVKQSYLTLQQNFDKLVRHKKDCFFQPKDKNY